MAASDPTTPAPATGSYFPKLLSAYSDDAPAAPGVDVAGLEQVLWLVPLMDAFEAACDAYARRPLHVDSEAGDAEEARLIGAINDARLALSSAVIDALHAPPADVAV